MLQSPAAQVGEGERKEKGTGESKKAPDYNQLHGEKITPLN